MTPLEYMLRWERRLREIQDEANRRYAEYPDRVFLDAHRRAEERRKELDREIMEAVGLS